MNDIAREMRDMPVAELVELSEAGAYASLAQPSAGAAQQLASIRHFGSAVAVMAPSVSISLNLNRVIGLGVRETCDEASLDTILQLYEVRGLSYAVEVSPFAKPAALKEWLRARQLRRGMPSAMYHRRLKSQQTEHFGVHVDRVDTAKLFEVVADICCDVFRMPAPVHALLLATRLDPRWRAWLAWLGPVPVAAALSFVDQGVAWLGWDAALPEYRGRGAHRALISARLADARANGCQHATAETAVHTPARQDPSGRNYEEMGFVLAYERYTYVAIRAAGPAAAY